MRNAYYELKDCGRSRSGLGLRWELPRARNSHPLCEKLDELQRHRNPNAGTIRFMNEVYSALSELEWLRD